MDSQHPTVQISNEEPTLQRFYHYSDEPLDTLTPQVGNERHGGEDDRAVDKPVVWLSTTTMLRETKSGGVAEYEHEVEVDLDDPLLHEDEKFNLLAKQFNAMIRGGGQAGMRMRWFFYEGTLEVIARRRWDGSRYQPDFSFAAE